MFIKNYKKIFIMLLFLLLIFSLTGCNQKAAEECIVPFSTQNEIKNFTFTVKDESDNAKLTESSARKYLLKADTNYFLDYSLEVNCANEPIESIVDVMFVKNENIKTIDVVEASTANVETKEDYLKLSYIVGADDTLSISGKLTFTLKEETDYFLDDLTVYAKSDNYTYLNNTDCFTYSISNYFGNKLGIDNNVAFSYLYFGKAPQTHVKNEKLIKQLNKITDTNSDGYYEYEGNEYAKISQSSSNNGVSYSDGATVSDGLAYFKVEPILWRIIAQDDDTYTLMSEYAIDLYADNYFNDVYNRFSKQCKSLISGRKVFTISSSSGYDCLSSSSAFKAIPTDYAIALGVSYDSSSNTCAWGGRASSSDSVGSFSTEGVRVSYIKDSGIRPFITISKGGYIFRNSDELAVIGSIVMGIFAIWGIVVSIIGIADCDETAGTVCLILSIVLVIAYLCLLFFTALDWWILLFTGLPMLVVAIVISVINGDY